MMKMGDSEMISDDLKRLSGEVATFSRKQGWEFKVNPILCWEFNSVASFHEARMALLRSLDNSLIPQTSSDLERATSGGGTEIDCYGITIRLICHQVWVTPHGPFNAIEMSKRQPPADREDDE